MLGRDYEKPVSAPYADPRCTPDTVAAAGGVEEARSRREGERLGRRVARDPWFGKLRWVGVGRTLFTFFTLFTVSE